MITVMAPAAADWNKVAHLQRAVALARPGPGHGGASDGGSLASLNIWSLWSGATDRRTSRLFAAAVPIGYWAPFFLAPLVPGTGLEDPRPIDPSR